MIPAVFVTAAIQIGLYFDRKKEEKRLNDLALERAESSENDDQGDGPSKAVRIGEASVA